MAQIQFKESYSGLAVCYLWNENANEKQQRINSVPVVLGATHEILSAVNAMGLSSATGVLAYFMAHNTECTRKTIKIPIKYSKCACVIVDSVFPSCNYIFSCNGELIPTNYINIVSLSRRDKTQKTNLLEIEQLSSVCTSLFFLIFLIV